MMIGTRHMKFPPTLDRYVFLLLAHMSQLRTDMTSPPSKLITTDN